MERLPAPFEAALLLTSGCNLHCPFCYEREWRGRVDRELSSGDWLKILYELSELQVLKLRLLGGEPLCSPAFEPLVREISKMKMRFSVISNGTLFTAETVRLVAESGRCDVVQLSLDGTEAVHDRLRGHGAFAKVIAAIRMLHDAGVDVKINSVVVRSALPEIPTFLELLESLPVISYRINPVGGDCPPTEKLDEGALGELGALLLSRRECLRKINPKSFPFVLQKLIDVQEADDDASGRCFRSHVQINIHADGAVTPCADVRSPICGYALQQPLREIWENEIFGEFRRRSRKDVTLPFPECRECRFRAVCRRYCPLWNPGEMCLKQLAHFWRKRGLL